MNSIAAINDEFQSLTRVAYGPAEIKARAVRVRTLRLSTIGIGFLSALVFIGFSIASLFINDSNSQKGLVSGDDLILSKPRFIGHSSSGGKITITAERAVRAIGSEGNVIELEKPHMVSEEGSDISSKTGVWDQNNQVLRLKDEVVMVYPTGDKVNSNSAYWGPDDPDAKPRTDLSLKEAAIASPTRLWLMGNVHFTRPSGETIDGQRAVWDSGAGRLSLFGNVIVSMKNGNATSQSISLDTNSRVVRGAGGVNISLPMGTGYAQSYEYYPDSRRLVLRGGARIVFK